MTTLRFLSPDQPSLVLAGVPATFVNGVFDIDDTDADRVSRLRYLGVPYGVIEMGSLTTGDTATGVTMAAIAAALRDPSSIVGKALLEAAPTVTGVQALVDDLAVVKERVDALAAGSGNVVGAVGTPATFDASNLPDWTLVALMSADPSA